MTGCDGARRPLPVAGASSKWTIGTATSSILSKTRISPLRPVCVLLHGDGVELMIAGNYLCDVAASIAKDDEVFDQIKKATAVEHTLENGLKFRSALRGNIFASHGSPWHESF